MPTLTVRKDIVFHYTDSGHIEKNESYSTILFVHGLSFHSGIFQKLLPVASSHSLRVICLSRREYQGSSPYTDEEIRIINHGTDEERAGFLKEQGCLIALFVDGIIQALSLPKGGKLTVVGWSTGSLFTIALRACIGDLPMKIRDRLRSYAGSFILWDPPSPTAGPIQNCQILASLYGRILASSEAFSANFPKLVSAHYKDVDLDSTDFSKVDMAGYPPKKPTTETMTPEELSSVLDFKPSFKCDIPLLLPPFLKAVSDQMTKALLDSRVNEDWGGNPVWHIWGDRILVVQSSSWLFGDKSIGKESDSNININFKTIKDANHFLMWEEPDRCLATMKECMLV